MDEADYFSVDYRTARSRFRAAAAMNGAASEAWDIHAEDSVGQPLGLTIDVAVLGADQPRRVVLATSGLHGVEGFFGSAIQLAILEETFAGWSRRPGTAVVLVHALCPFGFDQLRRTNEDGIDLNRNFLKPGQEYASSPPQYAALDALLNPTRPPGYRDAFGPRLYLAALLRGQRAVRQAIAGGQYDFPRGLFYGGHGPAATNRILAAQLSRWTESAERVVHLDFHTGLGPWATHKVLTAHGEGEAATRTLRNWFGPQVEATRNGSTAYDTLGGIDEWLENRLAGRDAYSVCAEFGTYSPLAVLSALRIENQAYHWAGDDVARLSAAKERLLEVFVPANREWRRAVVRQGVDLVRRAVDVCFALSETAVN